MKRHERRRLRREMEKASAGELLEKQVGAVVEGLLSSFYTTMRANKIGEERAQIIIKQTAELINNPDALKSSMEKK